MENTFENFFLMPVNYQINGDWHLPHYNHIL